jgi:hypothetical protein
MQDVTTLNLSRSLRTADQAFTLKTIGSGTENPVGGITGSNPGQFF